MIPNPRELRAIYQNERKSDRPDAQMLERIGAWTIPIMYLLFRTGRSSPLLTFALWPTSPFLIATEGHEHTLPSYLIVGATIAGNALVYVMSFAILRAVAWVIRASIRSLRDGTTI